MIGEHRTPGNSCFNSCSTSKMLFSPCPNRTSLAGDAAATRRYLAFISAGGSDYPVNLLKNAGVDMTTDEPLDLTIRKMNAVMDEMDKLLK